MSPSILSGTHTLLTLGAIGEMPQVFERLASVANAILKERASLPSSIDEEKVISMCDDLRALNSKLRAVGHLIENQDSGQIQPLDLGQINQGLSLIINEISQDIADIADKSESMS